MQRICILLLFFSALVNPVYAQDEPPLRIAVAHFLPPFITQGAHHELSGFDVDMMTQVCKAIHRHCKFEPMNIEQILPAVATKQVDLGLGALTITLDKHKLVNFSIPYMLSEARFLGKTSLTSTPFSTEQLHHKKIGVVMGHSMSQQLALLSDMNPTILTFKDNNAILTALNNGSIDLALVDNSTAIYWQNHSSNRLVALGKAFTVGAGLGIAINRDEVFLTKRINQAILQYQQSPEFKQMYSLYFGGF